MKYDNVAFEYNASGLRTSKTNDGTNTKFIWSGDKLLFEKRRTEYNDIELGDYLTECGTGCSSPCEEHNAYSNASIVDISYIQGSDGLTGFTISKNNVSETYYYRKNIQGDVTHILDSSGTVKAEYVYDAFGNHIVLDENGNERKDDKFIGSLNPFRYRGYYYDRETNLCYLKSRYYDPETGRFISADDIGILNITKDCINGLNLYAYCLNNPVNMTDENGQIFGWFKKIVKPISDAGNWVNNNIIQPVSNWIDSTPDWVKITIGVIGLAGAIGLTILTGGALAPVLIGFAASVGVSTLLGGVMAVYNSGGDWSQFGTGALGGLVDGIMFGGAFALAGASIGAVRYAMGAKGTVAGTKSMMTVFEGQQFDRYGGLGGTYVTGRGMPKSILALPPTNSGVKTTLQATRNFRVYTGIVAPAFGKMGGGHQYVMRYSIEKLIKKGWLKI